MPGRRAPPLVAVLAPLALALAGCSGISASATSLVLARGELAEVNVLMHEKDALDITWSSTASLHFDVHVHQAGKVVELVASNGTAGSSRFVAPQAGAYSVFWQAVSGDAKLTYSVHGAGVLQSVHPGPPT